MKKFLLRTVALIALGSVAQAADLPARAYVKAPPVPVFDWTGFYVGAYAGVGASRNSGYDPTGSADGVFEPNGYGFNGGGTVGYNWQLGAAPFGLQWVVGVEGDIGYLNTSRNTQDLDDDFRYNSKSSWVATLRGRIGVTDGPNLSYVTGGYAAVGVKDIFTNLAGTESVSSDKTRSGYVIGTGTETMLGGGWTAKSESLYIDVSGGDALLAPSGDNVEVNKHRYYSQRFGVNYMFGGAKTGPLPQTNWNGFFIGLTGGSAVGNTHAAGVVSTDGEVGLGSDGYNIGGQVGYNWMVSPQWVVGVEGDISYLSLKHSNLNYNNGAVTGTDASWIATARGRVGYSTGPALLYATAGGAWVNVKDSLAWYAPTSSTKTLGGYAVGGGIETVFRGAWTMKSEYLFIDAGRGNVLESDGDHLQFNHQYHLFRTGLTYRFNWGSPVVAKY